MTALFSPHFRYASFSLVDEDNARIGLSMVDYDDRSRLRTTLRLVR